MEDMTGGKKTITRRTLIDWLGKAVVIGLSSDLLISCIKDNQSTVTVNSNDEKLSDNPAISLSINEIPLEKKWIELTVDQQNLISLLNSWKLEVKGLVKNPLIITYAEMLNLPQMDQVSDFHCVTGWSVYDVPWNGFHLSSIFSLAEPLAKATHITFHSYQDIYTESLSLDDALNPATMMAYGINSSTIPLPHGFPLRLVVPYKFGYKNAKYIYGIEFTDSAQQGYYEADGYSYEGNIPGTRLRSK
jgi:DMSO/TMAO reductase YedYZ molybdopterin-dependent catalytic subunit